MEDGVELLADLVVPVGKPAGTPAGTAAGTAAGIPATTPAGTAAGTAAGVLPTIVIRGPYGRRGRVAKQAYALGREGFTVLFQSCRGTWGSGGVFTPQVDEQRDGAATHRWVREQPWYTGRTATFGASYMGFTQWAAAAHADALCLQVTMPDFGAVTWDNGAFALRNALGWTQMMDRMIRQDFLPMLLGMLRPDPALKRGFATLPLSAGDTAATGREVHWYQDWVRHESLADEYWTQQSHTAAVPGVTAPVYMITGWYDIFLPWQIRTHALLTGAGRQPRLTIGPWGHSDAELDATAVGEATAFLKTEATAFLKTEATALLKTEATALLEGEDAALLTGEARELPVRAYRTGAGQWHDLPSWPPPGVTGQTWHLHDGGRLHTDLPQGGITSYVYDPADPTPASGGPSLEPKQGPVDDAAHESRPDVAVFRGDVLTEDVTLAGTPVARIRFRSSQPSADVFVRITDVHPDGRSMSVCDAIRRVEAAAREDKAKTATGVGEAETATGVGEAKTATGVGEAETATGVGEAKTATGVGEAGAATREEEAGAATEESEVEIELWPVFHRFAAGHRISVQVSSGAHPRYARNPGSGEPAATATEPHRATQEISHDPVRPSHLDLPVWPDQNRL
ncbi:CocE/NonD family hydrolase [Actinoplanes couchii]